MRVSEEEGCALALSYPQGLTQQREEQYLWFWGLEEASPIENLRIHH